MIMTLIVRSYFRSIADSIRDSLSQGLICLETCGNPFAKSDDT